MQITPPPPTLERSEPPGRALIDSVDLPRVAWYVPGMTKKIAISLPNETLERAKTAVKRGKAPNVSNYIALLIDRESATESFEEMIAAWLHKSGATEREILAAEQQVLKELDGAGLLPKGRCRARARSKVG